MTRRAPTVRWRVIAGVTALALARSAAASDTAPLERVSLPTAIKRAIAHNPNAETARLEVERADALVRSARSASLPSLVVNGTYTRLDGNRTIGVPPNQRLIAAASALGANAILSVPLVAPRSWTQWSHAREGVDVAKAKAEDVRRVVAVAAARAYLAVTAQKRVIEANERALDTAKSHYDFAQKRHAGGLGNRLDEVRARNQQVSSEAQLQTSYVALARAREALAVLTGTSSLLDTSDDAAFVALPTEAVANAAAQHRSDVLAQMASARAADDIDQDNWADYCPTLSATGQVFAQHPATVLLPQTGWQAQVVLSIPVYDGGARGGLAEERHAVLREDSLNVAATKRQADSDVQFSLEEVRRVDQALLAAREAAASAKEALDLTDAAYAEGANTNLEVIDAQRTLNIAETQLVVAEDNAREARLDLLAASGLFP